MAKVGQILHIATREVPSRFDGAKNRTVSFTVAAGIADRQLTIGFLK
jgi:hypothetical protein